MSTSVLDLIALLVLTTTGGASSPRPEQPPETAPLVEQLFTVDLSNRMTVPVRVNGSDPMPFVVDTGAERTVIAHDFAQRLALAAGPNLRLATITGPAEVKSYLISKLSTDSVQIEMLEAPGLDRRNLGAYGLLGIDSLEKHKILIDFKGSSMKVLPSPLVKRGKKTEVEKNMIIVTARRKAGRMILSNAHIGSMKVDVILDTGASSSMGNEALRRRLRSSQRLFGYKDVYMRSVTGEILEGEFTQIRDINIGGINIGGLPITFSDNYAFDALDLTERPAILLGMDAMNLFDQIVVDFANRRVGFDLPKGVAPVEWLRQSGGATDSTGTIIKQ